MQMYPAIPIGTLVTVFHVAHDRAANLGQLRSNLMVPPGFKIYLQIIISVAAPNNFI